MAGRVRDAKLDSPTARARLEARGRPYYRALSEGLHLGYRKGQADGKWVARIYTGKGAYAVETVALADDRMSADGSAVLDFHQAQDRARARFLEIASPDRQAGPFTVSNAMADYVAELEHRGKPTGDTRNRIALHIEPELGGIEVAKITPKQIKTWVRKLADTAPRVRGKKGAEARYRTSGDSDEYHRRRRASANRTLTILKAALNLAWRESKVPSDAAWRKVEPFENADAARVRY